MANKRQVYNELILNKLSQIVQENPDLRFQQILQDYFIVTFNGHEIIDSFYEEPEITFNRLIGAIYDKDTKTNGNSGK